MSFRPLTGHPAVDEWLEVVESCSVAVCEDQKALAGLVRRTFEAEDLTLDAEQLDKYLGYQRYFDFDLFDWEKFVFALHNCVYTAEGMLRWPHLLMLLGRGAGKNGYLAFEDFCLLTPTNGVRDYHIDICATSEDQAKTSFEDVYAVLEANEKKMKNHFAWNLVCITNLKTGSRLRYRTSNAKTKDGGRPGKVDFDEIHAYESWDLLNVLTTGLGKKKHPRLTYATTDGNVRDAVIDEVKKKAAAILSGKAPDNGMLPFICRLDDEREVDDPAMWHKANPSLRFLPELRAEIEREYADYALSPATHTDFITKRMNLPKERADLVVTEWANIEATNRPLPDLKGETCVCGIDFARTTDFVSACLLFRGAEGNYSFQHTWVCRKSRDLERIKAPLDQWEGRGLLTFVDDTEIHPTVVTEWLAVMMIDYDVERVAIDDYRYTIMKRALADIGFESADKTVKLVRPSDIMRTQPVIDAAFSGHRLIWGDDPVMRWCANNAKLEPAPNNNYKYGKIEPKSRKTDAFMAFVAAMTLEDELPEPYEPGMAEFGAIVL